jgi:nitroreductase / dihydropteridine reductase
MKTNTQEITDAMNWRAAVKVFKKDVKVEGELLETILEATRLAPTAYGLQPVKVVDVSDNTELREKIKEAGYGQVQIVDAPHLFVVCAVRNIDEQFIDQYVKLTSEIRGLELDTLKGFGDMMKGDILMRDEAGKSAWAGRQAYLAFGSMITTAALLGVDAGPMEGFNPQKVDEILGLEKHNLRSLALVAVGYRDESDTWSKMSKVRTKKEDFVIKI